MKKIILILFYIVLLISCNKYNNKIVIINDSSNLIDSIILVSKLDCEPMKFKNIESGSKIDTILKTCNKEGGDGCFQVSLYSNGNIIKKSFGYFTNGEPFFSLINLQYSKQNDLNVDFH